MAFFCVVSILGGRKPFVVDCIVSKDEATSVVVPISKLRVELVNLATSLPLFKKIVFCTALMVMLELATFKYEPLTFPPEAK